MATWGYGTPEQDWKAAAEEAGRRVLEANPDMLVIVEGILSGGVLTGARFFPVKLPIQEKLVYSAHIYTFSGPLPYLPWPVYEPVVYQLQVIPSCTDHD